MRPLILILLGISTPLQPALSAAREVQATGQVAGSYRLAGDASIRPSLIWDDGLKTFLDWPANAELPAVFAVDARGGETLVNGYWRNGHYVIDAIYSRLIFRLDRAYARADRRTGVAA